MNDAHPYILSTTVLSDTTLRQTLNHCDMAPYTLTGDRVDMGENWFEIMKDGKWYVGQGGGMKSMY